MKNELGNLIREKRKQAKLTQRQLANRLNTTDKTVSKWETGEVLPDVFTMAQICDLLSISFDEFFNLTASFDEHYKSEVSSRMAELETSNKALQQQIEALKSQNDAFAQETRREREASRAKFERTVRMLKGALTAITAAIVIIVAGYFLLSHLKEARVPLKLKPDNVDVGVAYGNNADSYTTYVRVSVRNRRFSLDNLKSEDRLITLNTEEGPVNCLIISVSTTKYDRLFGTKQKTYVKIYENTWKVLKDSGSSRIDIRYILYWYGDLSSLPQVNDYKQLISDPKITVIWDSLQH